jgi:hypothetical protein
VVGGVVVVVAAGEVVGVAVVVVVVVGATVVAVGGALVGDGTLIGGSGAGLPLGAGGWRVVVAVPVATVDDGVESVGASGMDAGVGTPVTGGPGMPLSPCA